MTGQRPDPEQVIRNWLADSAPDRAPASLRETLESETSRPAGKAGPGPRLGAHGLRFAGRVAAAVAILAIAGSAAYFYSTSRTKSHEPGVQGSPTGSPSQLQPTSSSPSPSGQASSWHLVDPAFPKIGSDFLPYYQPQVFVLSSGGFVAFPSQGHGGKTSVFRSDNGTDWREMSPLPSQGAAVAAVVDAGERIVAVGFTYSVATKKETPIAWTTTDLQTWHASALTGGATGAFKVVDGPAGFLAWGSGSTEPSNSFWLSRDGVSWSRVTRTSLPASFETLDLFGTSGGYVIRGVAGNELSAWQSADGVTWTETWSTAAGSGTEYYSMGPTIKSPDGGYVAFGQAIGSASAAYDFLLWTSRDLTHWTMSDRIPSFGGVSAFGAAPSGYIVAGATPLPSKTGPGPCGPDVSKCIYGALGVWTSADGRNWQPLAGIAQITGFQVLSVASDGTHAIVVVKDNGDRVQLLVGDGL